LSIRPAETKPTSPDISHTDDTIQDRMSVWNIVSAPSEESPLHLWTNGSSSEESSLEISEKGEAPVSCLPSPSIRSVPHPCQSRLYSYSHQQSSMHFEGSISQMVSWIAWHVAEGGLFR